MKIWRGDSDPLSFRKLKSTLSIGDGLFTNMTNSGNPFALTQNGFLNSIHSHVVPGWNQSHFLSFSKSRKIAEGFAIGRYKKTLSLSNQTSWDTLISEFDYSSLVHQQNLAPGLDHYQFQEAGISIPYINIAFWHLFGRFYAINNRRKSGISSLRNILVIDVYQHLTYLASIGIAIDPAAIVLSKNDEEVLLLPLDPLPGGGGSTALLDFGCISNIQFYQLV